MHEHQAIDVDAANGSTISRLKQMRDLAERKRGVLDAETLRTFFCDESAGPLSICRDDIEGTSTNTAAILDPKSRTLSACHGLPSRASWVELQP